MEKICIKCLVQKDISLFVKTKNSCKECEKEYKRQYSIKNKEKILEIKRNYYKENKESIKERMKDYYDDNKDSKLEYQKEYVQKNKEYIAEYKKEHYLKNRESIREYRTTYQRERRKNDPVFKLKSTISSLIRNSFKNKNFTKNSNTIEILGCDIEFFINHIESKFTEDMNWLNHGIEWDIDHIIPLATAVSVEDVIRLNHYSNLQPLNCYINRNIKRDRIDLNI